MSSDFKAEKILLKEDRCWDEIGKVFEVIQCAIYIILNMTETPMDDVTWERHRMRTEIVPELVYRKDIQECALAISSMLLGEPVNLQVGRWEVSNRRFDRLSASFTYIPPNHKKAEFFFTFAQVPEGILMTNDHRHAYAGYGNIAFMELEHMAAALATMHDRQVIVQYTVDEQKSTRETLLRRGFREIDDIGLWKSIVPGMRRIILPLNIQ